MQVVEVISYKSFKERLQLMKNLKNCKIEVCKNYLYIERIEA
jgi:biotin synthase-like enzyme